MSHLQIPAALTAGVTRLQPALCHSFKPGWPPSKTTPQPPSKMHLPEMHLRSRIYQRETQMTPHRLWNSDLFFRRPNSVVLFSCTAVFLLHQYDGSFNWSTHPPHYKPCTWWSVTHQRRHQDNILPWWNLNKSNLNRCRRGTRGGISSTSGRMQHWDRAALADSMDFTACCFQIAVRWKEEEKDWGKERSAQWEWLRCGNLSIFEA